MNGEGRGNNSPRLQDYLFCYPVVRVVRAGDKETRIFYLAVDGPKGVSAEQAITCHACHHYGAAVSGLRDSMGNVYEGQWFDTVCNLKKVAARRQAEKAASQPGGPR